MKKTRDLLEEILEIIRDAEDRALAADGDVPKTVDVLEDSELRKIYRLAKKAFRLEGEKAAREPGGEIDREVELAVAIHNAEQAELLEAFRKPWRTLASWLRGTKIANARKIFAELEKIRRIRAAIAAKHPGRMLPVGDYPFIAVDEKPITRRKGGRRKART